MTNRVVTNIPTVLNPWYVIFKLVPDEPMSIPGNIEYYGAPPEWGDATDVFTPTKDRATTYNNLFNAFRIAQFEQAMIRVLTTKEEAEEFGHGTG